MVTGLVMLIERCVDVTELCDRAHALVRIRLGQTRFVLGQVTGEPHLGLRKDLSHSADPSRLSVVLLLLPHLNQRPPSTLSVPARKWQPSKT